MRSIHPKYLHFIKILIVEITLFFYFSLFYELFSFLIFGEGANSFMYSWANTLIFFILLLLLPSLFNITKMIRHRKAGNQAKFKNYIRIQIVITLIFITYLMYYWF